MMHIIGNLLYSLIRVVDLLILVRCVLSFIPINNGNKWVGLIYQLTEPILAPARNLLAKTPLGNMMVDFSPIVVILFISVIVQPIIRIIFF